MLFLCKRGGEEELGRTVEGRKESECGRRFVSRMLSVCFGRCFGAPGGQRPPIGWFPVGDRDEVACKGKVGTLAGAPKRYHRYCYSVRGSP